jgi:hypothetical protein
MFLWSEFEFATTDSGWQRADNLEQDIEGKEWVSAVVGIEVCVDRMETPTRAAFGGRTR